MAPVSKGRNDLKGRIRSLLLNDRMQCSELVLRLLQDDQTPYDSQVFAAARALGRGVAGSGNMCGAVVAGVMALGIEEKSREQGTGEGDMPLLGARAPEPRNDWLDTFSPTTSEPRLFERARELMKRATGKV